MDARGEARGAQGYEGRPPVPPDGPTGAPPTQGAGTNRKVIHASCTVHRGPAGFANLVVSKRNGQIELDSHVDGSCVLTLAEDAAIALRDALTQWLG
jgi:hypothetical protein